MEHISHQTPPLPFGAYTLRPVPATISPNTKRNRPPGRLLSIRSIPLISVCRIGFWETLSQGYFNTLTSLKRQKAGQFHAKMTSKLNQVHLPNLLLRLHEWTSTFLLQYLATNSSVLQSLDSVSYTHLDVIKSTFALPASFRYSCESSPI